MSLITAPKNLTPITDANPQKSNWQLFADPKGSLWSFAIVDGAKDSYFGNKKHLIKLIRDGHFDVDKLNDHGREFLSGLCNRRIGPLKEPENQFWLLSA